MEAIYGGATVPGKKRLGKAIVEIRAIEKVVRKLRWHIMECGGKRSATPLWLWVMLADE